MALQFTSSADMEDWLAKNTNRCALGRLTVGQCAANRARPSPAEHYRIDSGRDKNWKKNAAKADVFRPGACDACTQRQENNRETTGDGDVAQANAAAGIGDDVGRIIKCKVCEEMKNHKGKGLCATCYDNDPEVKKARIGTCKVCREEKQIVAFGMCVSCYGKDPDVKAKRAARRAARKAAKAAQASDVRQPAPAQKKADKALDAAIAARHYDYLPANPHILQIDFSGCPEVFAKIKQLADAEDRNPDQQARFILRGYVDGMKPDDGA
jgi:hypothetical protein